MENKNAIVRLERKIKTNGVIVRSSLIKLYCAFTSMVQLVSLSQACGSADD